MKKRAEGARALLARYALPASCAAPLEQLLALLARDSAAPTAVRCQARILDDHLADALVALELDVVRAATSAADIGSGAGIPGLPLAVALPRTSFALIESNGRKCAFIERAVAAAGLRNVHVVHARVEQWLEGCESRELVVARAVAPLPVVLEYAAPLLRLGGALVVWRGSRDATAEAEAVAAARELGLAPGEVRSVEPYTGTRARHLHVFVKEKPTPADFPRRPGVARKRPVAGHPGRSDRRRR
jgi:16S rRNA (guanine527-N7)-methyltransferase